MQRKVATKSKIINIKDIDIYQYDTIIGLEWSMKRMVLGWKSKPSEKAKIIERESSLEELKKILKKMPGKKIMTIEESTGSHLLYCELKDKYVDKIIICDPYYNKIIGYGPKNDIADAGKLCDLLGNKQLNEVSHEGSKELYEMRKLISSYDDVVKIGVQAQNQKKAVYRGLGITEDTEIKNKSIKFAVDKYDEIIDLYDAIKEEYENKFKILCQKQKILRYLKQIPGISNIRAVKIYGTIIIAERFKNKGNYLSYCGLVLLDRESGGRSYGKKKSRYSRVLKECFIGAMQSAVGGNNPVNEYYEYHRKNGLGERESKVKTIRYIALASLGIIKHGEKYEPYKWRENLKEKNKAINISVNLN
jgi:hypothetical protein